MPGLTSGHNHKTVVGGRVAVHGDAVERLVGHALCQTLHQRRCNGCIGGHKPQHGRHVWTNHTGTFGNTSHRNGVPVNHALTADSFRLRVSRHDANRSVQPRIGLQAVASCRNASVHTVYGQRLQNNTRRKRQDLFRLYT